MRAPRARAVTKVALVLACLVALGGCSTVKGWFSSSKSKNAMPSPLTEFAATAKVDRLWAAKLGGGDGVLAFGQGPAIADGRVYAAALGGGVSAYDLHTGASVWQQPSELKLSSGPGVGDGLVVVGSLEGDVVALDAATGAQKWTAKVGTEVLAAPAIGQGLVIVRSIDGRVSAFDEASGERRWFWDKETPTLAVRGNAGPVLAPGFAFIGNDDGSLSALSLAAGRQLWQQIVGSAEGRTELDRMADIDGTPALDGTTIYASSYKKQTMAIDGPSGRPIWLHDAGGAGSVGVSPGLVVVSDPQGIVWGLNKSDGSAMWQQPALERRNLSGVAVQGDYAVVGDYDGYLHWLRLSDGAIAARSRPGKDMIRAAPVVADGILVVQDTGGEISAWRVSP
ncbi:MAG: outer membrane protein assembly factor BamB [Luteimonas sp.]